MGALYLLFRAWRLWRLWRALRLLWIVAVLGVFAQAALAQSGPPPVIDLSRLFERDAETRRIAVTMVPGIRSVHDLPTEALKDIRTQLAQGQTVPVAALQALADAGDGGAALRLLKRAAAEAVPVEPLAQAHYYGMAAATGRVAGLTGLVRTLDTMPPEAIDSARAKIFARILTAYADAGNTTATAALLRYHHAGAPLGPLDAQIEALARTGHGQIALSHGMARMQAGWDTPEALRGAREFLEFATNSSSLRAQVFAETMLSALDERIAALAETNDPPG